MRSPSTFWREVIQQKFWLVRTRISCMNHSCAMARGGCDIDNSQPLGPPPKKPRLNNACIRRELAIKVLTLTPSHGNLWYAWYLCKGYIINSAWPTSVDLSCRLSICVEVVQYHVVQPADLLLARVVRRRDVSRLPHDCNRIEYASQLVRV